jgi:hypothetical protein
MDEMKQRVPSDRLARVCEYSKTWLEPTEAKAFALDLRDARARIAELEAALQGRTQFCAECEARARRVEELRKWRPIDEIHEDHFPVLVADPREMSNTQFLMWIDDWHELEGQADYTLFHSLKPLGHEGYCPILDAAIDAAKGEKG